MNTRQRRTNTASKTEIHDAPTLEPTTPQAQSPNFAHQFGQISVYPDLEPLNLQSSFERGPFSSDINRVLATAFNEPLEGLSVMRGAEDFNQAINARASAIGSSIYLNADITESLSSPDSMEIIAHEVAHALRPSHSTKLLSQMSDSSEHIAHEAGRAVRGGLERGEVTVGSASAASSGEASIQRWEGFEHKRSVDQALGNLAPGTKIDPAVQAQLEAKIKLANGLEVSPGQITALMGDLYGKFDDKGMLDPAASFKQLNNADPKEMNKLLGLLAREDKTGESASASEWEAATRNRRGGDDSYLELAQRNDSHFSAASNTGTDNNLGTYAAFHQMALEAAAKGDMNTARAMEASSMHYLTDRHSAGHNFDKSDVMDASGRDSGGILANMAVKTAHDDLNEHGTTVANATGDTWKAYGDGHWEDEANKENRQRTAQSVYGSWNELNQAATGARSPASLEKAGYGAFGTAPQFDQQRQEGAEGMARNTNPLEMLWNYGGDLPDAVMGKAERAFGQYVENPVSDAWDWTKDKAGQAVNWIGDTASGAWDWTQEKAGQAVDWAGEKAGDAWDWTKQTASDAGDWVGDKAQGAWNAAGDAADWAGNKAGQAADWASDKASNAVDWAGEKAKGAWNAAGKAADWVGNKAGDAWDATKTATGKAADWVGDKAEGAWNAAGTAANWAGDKAEKATDWVGDKASSAVNYVEDNFTLDPRKMEFDPRKWF